MKKKNIIKISAIVFSIILVIVAITTTTQSYFNKDNYAKNPTEYQTGLLSIEAVSKSNNISLSNTLPMSDTEGEQIEPYVFTIRNNGNVDYKFNIKLLSTSDNTFSPEYIKLKIDDDGIRTLASLTDSIIKEDVILPAGETIDITLRVWLSSDTKNTQIGKTFNSKIVIDGQSIYTSTNQDVQKYTIDYDTNGGTGAITSQDVIKGNKITLSTEVPTKEGYTFKGWDTSKTKVTPSYQPGDTITIDKNTKLYAIWEVITYTLKITGSAGVEKIEYKLSTGNNYKTNAATPTTIIIDAIPGETYYYYGIPSTGYSITSCTASVPCSVVMGTNAVTKTITATKSSSSSSYTVIIKKKNSGTISTLTTETINAGESFSYLTTYSKLNDNYQGISCTNGQTPTVSIVTTTNGKLSVQSRQILIKSVTADTTCTLTYGSSSGGGTSEY